MSLLPAIEIESCKDPDISIIWLHGLGATNQDFVPIIPELNLPESLKIRFIFPQAPSIPVTINQGYVMPAWYDLLSMDIDRKVDERQLKLSASEIQRFIDKEIDRGIESKNIIVAGFSQGAAVSYEAALTYSKPLGGLLTLSGYLATMDSIILHDENRKLSIFMGHGTNDEVVPVELSYKAEKYLMDNGYFPKFNTYPIEHTVSPEEVKDISNWIQSLFN